MQSLRRFLSKSSLLAASVAAVSAGTFTSDFNTDTNAPAGSQVNGTTVIEASGGVNDSGVLKLTKAINAQGGSFVVGDLDQGNPVYGFDLTAKILVGGGTGVPADGFSINFDPGTDLSTTTGEEGTPSGLTFAFDIYDNGNETPPAPSIDLKIGGTLVATHKMSVADFDTGTDFVDLHAQVAADGAISLAYKGQIIFTNLYSALYQPLSAANLVIGGRTGGLNENMWIDNLTFTTYTQPKVGISQQPKSLIALAGQDVVLSVTANNADTATYQWFKNGTAIAGATSSTLSLPDVAAADSGAKYKVTVTGPNNTATSDEITVSVRDIPGPTAPKISFDFNDGATPANATLYSPDNTIAAYVAPNGGVNDSGVLHLVDAINGAYGALIVSDVDQGKPVYGITASFDVLVGGGTDVPADGFSFNFGSDISDTPTGAEEGLGTGLSVDFDIYDNGGGEAPAIDVRAGGKLIVSTNVPLSFIATGDTFVPVLIRLQNDGTIDVVYNGVVVFDNVPVPGISSISGGRVVLAGRTGGLNDNIWIDNLNVSTDLTPGDLRITTQPTAQIALVGKPVTFSVGVNDTNGVTYQWFRNGTAITGATSNSFTIPALAAADTGAKFKVQVTKGALNVTSDEVTLTGVDVSRPANPTLALNFDDGQTPANTVLAANDSTIAGYISANGGVNDSGVLHLVDAVNGAAGAFVINPLLNGAEIGSFTAAIDLRIGGGSVPPADGFSFNFAPDLATTTGAGEDGSGTGITVGFDIYDNGNETPPAPSVDIRYKGQIVSSLHLTYQQIETGDAFKTLVVHLAPDGKLDVAFGDQVLFNAVQLPNYTPISNGKFGLYARTGGLNENIWADNIAILAVKSTAPLRITQDLTDIAVLAGTSNVFSVAVSDPNGATYQWFKNGVAIAGATSASFTPATFTAADNGAKYKVTVTGPGGTVTSHEAVVSVIPALTISNPKFSINFDDGVIPDNAIVNGTAYLPGDGSLHLTDAVNGQGGSFVVSDLDNGEAVSGFTLHAKVLVGGGSTPPADGFSIVWANDMPNTTVFGEDGSGGELVISFDIYDNGNEIPPAPSIDVRYKGKTIGTVHMPYQQIETGTDWADVYLRVEADGTLDLQYKNMVLFNNLQLPGYAPLAGGVFGIGARTGGLNENQWIDDLQISTSTGAVAPSVTIARAANGALTVSWTGAGTLQARDTLDAGGTWQTVTGATSPYSAPNDRAMRFFRVLAQ